MSTSDLVRCEAVQDVALVTLNDPAKRNALSAGLVDALIGLLESLIDDDGARVVVLTGSPPSFCAGADLKRIRAVTPLEDRADYARNLRLFRLLWDYPKPTIAAVAGHALGGGVALVTNCDLAVAEESAQFGYPEVRAGLATAVPIPSLQRSIPRKRMFDMLLSGKPITGREAEAYGLVNRVVADGAAIAEATRWARELAAHPIHALIATKNVVRVTQDMEYNKSLEYAREARVLSRVGEDFDRQITQYADGARYGRGKSDAASPNAVRLDGTA